MLFVTHLAAAAVVGRLSRLPTAPLVVGAAAPDVLDKPLGAAGIVELYHSVGHSALAVVALLTLALFLRVGTALTIGWVSHLFLDVVQVVINGRPGHALFLLWPLKRSTDPLGLPPVAFVRHYIGTSSFYIEVVLWLALVGGLAHGRFRNAPTHSG